ALQPFPNVLDREGLHAGPFCLPARTYTSIVASGLQPDRLLVVCTMRLERIEINGFKSFSDRSELAFDKGVTAIVGPNGCGKSNVADAITWVMGEQSAKSLRGERMEDVIFNGSDARKPTASAEVRLRFSGFLKTVTGPAFDVEPGHNGHSNGHSNGNGNGHGN